VRRRRRRKRRRRRIVPRRMMKVLHSLVVIGAVRRGMERELGRRRQS